MKHIQIIVSILLLFSTQKVFSQTQTNIGDRLKSKFENFEYENVIKITDSLLKSDSKLSKNDSIQIFYYRSISAFHLWDINSSEDNFKILLSLDKNFILDSTEVSPKIVNFFNQIKKKELEKSIQKIENKTETNQISSIQEFYQKNFSNYKGAIWRNLIFPGWGNLFLKENTKGYILTLSFTLSFISSVYFYFDTNSKEKEYLAEVIPEKISEKYNAYNSSYKLRNFSLISLGLIYLYSQFDLLSRNPFQENSISNKLSLGIFQNKIQAQLNLPLR